ncbi:MAG: 23S rRNA (cytosine(1962)-C(5))-methyltransferase RlmI [Anaerolineales bacterium]|nr:23S rRNA (cytosine(1962)-C(5))-methyltransferase RlmI [Anaerolineales bacterium]
MKAIILKGGRERSVMQRHPWIFASAVAEVQGDPEVGGTMEVLSHEGEWLAYAAYSPKSQIQARVWTWNRDEIVNESFLAHRLDTAIKARANLKKTGRTSAFREVHAESDGLPGLIVDRYNDIRVIQFLSAGVERWRQVILDQLTKRGDCAGIYERSDADVRGLEGLPALTGPLWGEAPEPLIDITENNLRYLVDVRNGHKTGFYLDQKENRRAFAEMMQPGASVLDGFSYTGSFSAVALRNGAGRVIAIDSSATALDLIPKNVSLNSLALESLNVMKEDVFVALRLLRDQGREFDHIILDPPKFAPTSAHLQKASRGYKDINLLALKLLKPGGLLFTFSCSGGISPELFQKIVSDAALDAGKRVVVIRWLGQPSDHPVALNFPEGRYLKGLVCQVVDNF